MAELNKVLLIGRLTQDPELRYIPAGTAVATLRLAVNRNFIMKSGEKKEETCFVNVVVWNKQAEACGEYLSKGKQVFVEGCLQSRSWEDQEGRKKSTIEIRADRVQFLDKREEHPKKDFKDSKEPQANDDIPF